MVQLQVHHVEYCPIPPETLSYFQSTAQWPLLAQKFFCNSSITPFHIEPRSLGTDRQFTLINKTLATESTFKAWQGFWKASTPSAPSPGKPYGEFISVLALGQDLNGHLDTLHGGITSVLLDEISGQAAYCHRDLDRIALTMTMNIDYKRPINTPGIVIMRAWLNEGIKGRQMAISALVEDLDGAMYASADIIHREVALKKFEERSRSNL